jgi:hypothetical protein
MPEGWMDPILLEQVKSTLLTIHLIYAHFHRKGRIAMRLHGILMENHAGRPRF